MGGLREKKPWIWITGLFLFLLGLFAVMLKPVHPTESPAGSGQLPAFLGPAKLSRIIVADDVFSVPYSFLDAAGRPAGISVDIWKLWSRKTGIAVEFRLLPWNCALSAVQSGNADARGSMPIIPGYTNVFSFTCPLFKSDASIFFHEKIKGLRGLEDLQEYPVGAVNSGSKMECLLHHPQGAISGGGRISIETRSVMEDEALLLEISTTVLTSLGYTVLAAQVCRMQRLA
ncbi:MAG: transporter substrate-binding domain-containing protein [Desulfocapsaceae bacterium]|nr:transporter substrate-binding domain-containing protein [Desulfocapsaceae bacterium]